MGLLLLAGAPAAAAPCIEAVRELRDAQLRLGSSEASRPTTLPDRWREQRPDAPGPGRYTLEFEVAQPGDEACALLLSEVDANVVAHLNGHWIGQGGRVEEPVAHNFNRPLLFPFSADLLRPGPNRLELELHTYAHHVGTLGPLWIGAHDALEPIHARALGRRVGLAQASTFAALITGIFVGVLWIAMRGEALYGWFVLAALAWAVNSLNYWVRDIPMSHWAWDRLTNAALDQFPIFLALWARHRLGMRWPSVRTLLAASAVMAGFAAFTPRSAFITTILATHAAALALAGYVVFCVVRHRARLSRVELAVYAFAGTIGVVLSLGDLTAQVAQAGRPPTLPLALALIVPAFGVSLVVRFVGALREAEDLNISLEARVRAREAKLTENFERMRQLERQAVLARERERVTREMHDGIGGQLVSALALVEGAGAAPSEVAVVLRDALTEMRLVLDSLDPRLGGVGSLLAQLRSRLAPSLEAAGMRLEWAVGDLPDTSGWSPDQLLHVMRIVQEAIANAVRHSRATRIRLAARTVRDDPDDSIEISIEDDGCGIAPDAEPGRGLHNIRTRAGYLGAALEIAAANPGTRVTLRVSIRPAGAAPS